MKNIESIKQIYDLIGRERLQKLLGVTNQNLSNQLSRGFLPASWFQVIRDELNGLNASASERLFNFKEASK